MRPVFQWNIGRRALELGKRTLIMGVINVTPDSFSDGGQFLDADKALDQAGRLLEEGADILDIGGESTRPGVRVNARSNEALPGAGSNARANPYVKVAPLTPLTAKAELDRVLPVISAVKRAHPDAPISTDTYKSEVARAAVDAGAEIVNDVSGFRWDPRMPKTIADLRCGAILMHSRGKPDEWSTLAPVHDIVSLVKSELKEWAERAVSAGVKRERIVLDPGFGFGKRFAENYPLIACFEELQLIGFPLLAGVSRKSFIGRTLRADGKDVPPEQRLHGTLAVQTALILKGVHILRTHDVKAAVAAARVADTILQAQ